MGLSRFMTGLFPGGRLRGRGSLWLFALRRAAGFWILKIFKLPKGFFRLTRKIFHGHKIRLKDCIAPGHDLYIEII